MNKVEEKQEKLFTPIPYIPKTIEVRSIINQIDKKYITVGRTLNNLVNIKNSKNKETIEDREYMKQQRDFTWEKWRSSNLIYSIMLQRNINEILLYRPDATSIYVKTIDGQQRLTTIWKFINNLFPLVMKKASFSFFVVGDKKYPKEFLNGKYFKDLPEDWQELILSYNLRAIVYNNCSDEQARQIYIDIAMGTKPLRSIETRKALISNEIADMIDDFLDGSWTLHTMTSTAALGTRGMDVVSQFFALVKTNGIQLNKDNIDRVMYEMRDDGVSQEFKDDMVKTKEYLNKTFNFWINIKKEEEKEKKEQKIKGRRISNFRTYRFTFVTNKIYNIMLIWAAYRAYKLQIDINKFQKWAFKFFQNPSTKFKEGLANGRTKANDLVNVKIRLEAIEEELVKIK